MHELDWNSGEQLNARMPGETRRPLAATWLSATDMRELQAGRPDTLPAWAVAQANLREGHMNYNNFEAEPRDRWASYAVDATLAMVLMVVVLVVW
jgi:hypothetical protein